MSRQLPVPIIDRLAGKTKRLGHYLLSALAFLLLQPCVCRAAVLPWADSSGAVFIKILPSKINVYKGEAFTVKYLLYYDKSITDPENELDIKFKNCYTQEYTQSNAAPDETIGNRLYHVVLLKKFLLIPQTEGPLLLPGISFNLKMTVAADKDDYFGADRSVVKRISAKAITLNVNPLPARADSLQFSGAVGEFKVKCDFEPSKFSNLLGIRVHINGSGNLMPSNLTIPSLPPGIDFTKLPNTVKDSLAEDGLKTDYTFSFQLLANYRGDFTLAPITFVYFSPAQNKYITFVSPPYKWQVNTGPALPASLKNGKGISIKADPVLYTKMYLAKSNGNRLFFRSGGFYLLIFLSGGLYLLGIMFNYQKKRQREDMALYNFKTARRKATRNIVKLRLVSARLSLDVFNKRLIEILEDYLNRKQVLGEEESLALHHKNISPKLRTQVAAFLNEQNAVRFSPFPEFRNNRRALCLQLTRLIKNLDASLK